MQASYRVVVKACDTLEMILKNRVASMADTIATRVLITMFSLALVARVTEGMMDITAFEYIRKFSDPLDLGECPRREVPIEIEGFRGIEKLRCSRRKFGNVTSLTRPVHSQRNAPISTPGDIIAYLGLCGGEAASFLGILNNGDCVAIEIASKLTFSEKTIIRAYVEYYRKGLDILENNMWQKRKESGTKDDAKYYLKNISYGTLEIIIVQFRFRSRKDTHKARELKAPSSLMSVYMETVRKEVGTPANLLIIRLSAAEKGQYHTKTFKSGEYAHALRYVQIMEGEIKHLREEIRHDKASPHLRYSLYPFDLQNKPQSRIAPRLSSEMWEKTSVLEITLRQAITIGKKAAKRCRKVRTPLCKRVRTLLRTLKQRQRNTHKSRARWMDLNLRERKEAALNSTSRINSYGRTMKRLARSVRKWWKIQKLEKLKRKKQRKNLTGVKGPNKMRKRRKY